MFLLSCEATIPYATPTPTPIQPMQEKQQGRTRKHQIPISGCFHQQVGESPKLWTTDYQGVCAPPPTTCRFLEEHRNKPKATGKRPRVAGSALQQKVNQRKGCFLKLSVHLTLGSTLSFWTNYLPGPKIINKNADYHSGSNYLGHYLK